jgi:hypothetical protein
MSTKALLLQSVSAIATAAVVTGPALAQDANNLPKGYTYSVQGGGLFSAADTSLTDKAGAKTGSGIGVVNLHDLPTDAGYNAALTLGKHVNNAWDVAFGASLSRLLENSGTVSSSGGSSLTRNGSGFGAVHYSGLFTEKTSLAFESMDFEVGFTPKLESGMNVRLFGGLRGLHFVGNRMESAHFGVSGFVSGFAGSGSFSSFNGSFDLTNSLKSEFLGIGPRIGFSGSKRFDGSKLGLSGSLAAAAIFGHQTDTRTSGFASSSSSFNFPPGTSTSGGSSHTSTTSTESTKLVMDMQLSAGLDYYLNDSSTLTVGYQAEQLTNVGAGPNSNENKLVQGPFVKLTGGF